MRTTEFTSENKLVHINQITSEHLYKTLPGTLDEGSAMCEYKCSLSTKWGCWLPPELGSGWPYPESVAPRTMTAEPNGMLNRLQSNDTGI